MFIKICGITRRADAELSCELGATAIGFIFWPQSPRFIDPHRARAISRELPPDVAAVGVFVNQSIEYVRGVSALVHLGAIQLHGDEPAGYIDQLRDRVIRAIGLDGVSTEATVSRLPPQTTVLLDAHDPHQRGGTGKRIDWDAAKRIARQRRTILSGGLAPENVRAAIEHVRPYGVDVSSGVEAGPGIKDPEKLRAFFAAVRAAFVQ